MAANAQTIETVEGLAGEYKYGFVTDIESELLPKGLSEDTIRFISAKKEEPQWMLDWRLRAYKAWLRMAKEKGLATTARRVLASLATIKSGDIILPLVDGRELRLRRVSRPDQAQAELLTRLDLNLPEKLGTDAVSGIDVVQTR